MPRPDEDDLGAAPERLGRAHRRPDPESARDVVRRRYDAAALGIAADDERSVRKDGSSSSSTAAKNASRSRWARIGTPRTLRPGVIPRASAPRDRAARVVSALLRRVTGRRAGDSPRVVRVGGRMWPTFRSAAATSSSASRCRGQSRRCGHRDRRQGRRGAATVDTCSAPRGGAPVLRAPRRRTSSCSESGGLAAALRSTTGSTSRTSTTGAGAAWNARATLPGASTLKLAIAVPALARTDGTPAPGSTLDRLLRRMLDVLGQRAANATEIYFGGSTIRWLRSRQRD